MGERPMESPPGAEGGPPPMLIDSLKAAQGACSRIPPESSALACTFADYFGLCVLAPTLPFYLEEIGVTDLELWMGIILSAQFAAIVISNPAWGIMADRYGAKLALLLTMLGDTVFFGVTAAATTPPSLVVVRFLAGLFSPLVPALALIFKVVPAERTNKALGTYSLAICAGYVLGSAIVGALYDRFGFAGVQTTAAFVAVLAAAFTLLSPSVEAPRAAGVPVKVSGVGAALQTPAFLVFAATQFYTGFAMNLGFSVLPIALRAEFGWNVTQVGFAFLALAGALAFQFIYAVPTLMSKLGIERLIALALLVVLLPSALLASPPVREYSGVLFSALVLFHVSFMTAAQLPAIARGRFIGMRHTQNGTGAVTGAGRTFFALGQAVAPAVSLVAYSRLGPAAPWIMHILVVLATIAVHVLAGVWPMELRTHPPISSPATATVAVLAVEGAPASLPATNSSV